MNRKERERERKARHKIFLRVGEGKFHTKRGEEAETRFIPLKGDGHQRAKNERRKKGKDEDGKEVIK